MRHACLVAMAVAVAGCTGGRAEDAAPDARQGASPMRIVDEARLFRYLFDGTSLDGWRVLAEDEYAMRGPVRVDDGALCLGRGASLTGVVWAGEPPRAPFEVELDAMRTEGEDFFCGLTVPVGDGFVTWIVGGWGGGVVGLSNVDGMSAAENGTTTWCDFVTGRWYALRLRVDDEAVTAWIDGEEVFAHPVAGHAFEVWPQQKAARPLGITAWETGAALRDIRLWQPDVR